MTNEQMIFCDKILNIIAARKNHKSWFETLRLKKNSDVDYFKCNICDCKFELTTEFRWSRRYLSNCFKQIYEHGNIHVKEYKNLLAFL